MIFRIFFSCLTVLALMFDFVGCQTGVCQSTQSYYVSVSHLTYRQRQSTYRIFRCSGWWCGYENRVRYHSQSYYRSISEIRYRTQYYCCSGYLGNSPYCSPVCSQGCDHGSCISPNYCSCNNGWSGSSCNIDVNECANNHGGCDQKCTNNMGSYSCSCNSGYTLSANQRTCLDIDECENGMVMVGGDAPWGSGALPEDSMETYGDWCEQRCVNTDGGYKCGCLSGYSLQQNNITCSDINECSFLNGRCEHSCYNTEGSYFCTCRDGFLLLDDGLGCTDHDECKNNTHGCEHECHNTHGSYRCDCYDGYRLNGTTDCEDIDECSEALSGCSDICTNYEGYYECECLKGFELAEDNKTCIDINECMNANGGCDQVCHNRPGSYRCLCRDGYTLASDEITCNAEPCFPILTPFNGNIQCTNDSRPPVTDDTCNFTCNIGYELMGSKIRTCQPNHTWSGVKTYCEILKCEELTAPVNAIVAQPCINEFSSSCRVLCNQGYRVNATSMDQLWTQTCVLNNVTGLVNWTEASSCTEIKICDVEPPPCGPGTCSVGPEGGLQCDCEGTYHTGDRCQIAFAVVGPIKTLEVNEPYDVTITTYRFAAMNRRSIRIKTTSGSSGLQIPFKEMIFPDRTGLVSVTFTLTARIPGRYVLSYIVHPDTDFLKLQDSTILAVSTQSDQEIGYFDSNDVEAGILVPGCCFKEYRVKMSVCTTTTVFFRSSCTWQHVGNKLTANKGIIFMTIGDVHLPLSISGITDVSRPSGEGSLLDLVLPQQIMASETCDYCDSSEERLNYETEPCYNPDPRISFNSQDTQTFLKFDSILRTFLKWLKFRLPAWVTVTLPFSSTIKDEFASYDFSASLLNAQDILKQKGCETIDFDSKHQDSKKYYVLRTTSTLEMSFHSSRSYLSTNSVFNKPQCIVLDVCGDLKDLKLYYSIPSSLQPNQLFDYVHFFKPLITSSNGSMTYSSIKLFLKGNEQLIVDDVMYWNGTEFFRPQLSSFELVISNFQMNKIFFSPNADLEAKIISSGLLYYQSNPSKHKVPGVLKGSLSMEISIIIDDKLETLYLNSLSEASVSLFNIPGTMASQLTDAISPGLAFKLEYDDLRSTRLFSNILEPFDSSSGSGCIVDGFMSLNDTFTLTGIYLASNCLSAKINRLRLPTTFNFTSVSFVTTSPTDLIDSQPINHSIIVQSGTSTPRASIGSFIQTFSSRDNPRHYEAVEIIHHTDKSLSGSVRDVNISIFDAEIYMESMPIENSALSIQGNTNVFNHLNVEITGKASTDANIESMILEVDLEVTNDTNGFKKNATRTLNRHLETEIKHVIERRENIHVLHVKAGTAYKDTSTRFNETSLEYQLLLEKLNSTQAKVEQLQIRVNETELAFQAAFLEHSNLMSTDGLDAVCTEEECGDVCEPGVSCTTCYNVTTVEEFGTCQTTSTAVRSVTDYRIKTSRSWRYELRCRSTWRIFWFIILPIFSFGSRCSRACVPYTKYSYDPYIRYETYTKIIDVECVTRVLFSVVPSECCDEYPCANRLKNATCLLQNENCQKMKQEELKNANSTVQAAYRLYTQTKANLTLAQVELEQIKAKYSSVGQQLKLLEEARKGASITLEIRRKSKEKVFENTKLFEPLIELFYNQHDNQYIIEIDQIFWHVTLTLETRVLLPVTIQYQYINQTDRVTFVINLQDSVEAHDRLVSTEILNKVVGESGTSRRRKRQVTSIESGNYLSEVCVELENLGNFLSQVIDSLNDSSLNFQSNMDKLNKLLTNNSIEYNDISANDSEFAISLKQSLASLQTEKALAVTTLSSLLKENSFIEWQKATEMIYGNGSEINEIECTSFADCLQLSLNSLELILDETPGSSIDSIKEQLSVNRNSIINVALSENYTFDNAIDSLTLFEDILTELHDIDYWCADPPAIINTPPLEVNISIGDTLNIDCIVSSSLPVQYFWKRESLLLSAATGSTLSVHNIQMSESGKYQCTVVSDAGRMSSLTTTVNVYYSPIFNQTLQNTPLIQTYDGYDNGISLSCDAHSWPPPGWKWLYRATQTDDWIEIYDVDANILTLDKISLMDEGWYTCVAYNWLGNETSTPMFIHVLPAQIPTTKYRIDIEFEAFSFSIDNVLDNIDQLNVKMEEGIKRQLPLSSVLIQSLELSQLNTSNDTILSSFYISTPTFQYNKSFTTEDIILLTASSLMELDKVKSNITDIIARPSGLQIELDDEMILSSVSSNVNPRFLSCPNGYEAHSNQIICVGCRSGYNNAGRSVTSNAISTSDGQYLEQLVSTCMECGIGEYQPYRAQSQCIKCPQYHTTTSTASDELKDCIALCEVNTYSSDGLSPCIQCPSGYCQPDYGRDECIPCPDAEHSSTASSNTEVDHVMTTSSHDKPQSTMYRDITVGSSNVVTSQSPNVSFNDTSNKIPDDPNSVGAIVGSLTSVVLVIVILLVIANVVILIVRKKWHTDKVKNRLAAIFNPIYLPQNAENDEDHQYEELENKKQCV